VADEAYIIMHTLAATNNAVIWEYIVDKLSPVQPIGTLHTTS